MNAANKYARDVLSGKVLACKWVKAACQRHQDDIERSKKDSYPYYFAKDKAERVCKFIEKLSHIKGKWAGTKIRLEPWQKFIVCSVFGWLSKADDTRRFRTVLIEVPRKNAKALALDTKIPIPFGDGWKTMGEIKVGDSVFDENGEICKVIAVSDIFENHKCYRVNFSNGESVVADAGHLWVTTARVNKIGDRSGRHISRFRPPKLRKRIIGGRESWYAQLYGKQVYLGSVKDRSKISKFKALAKEDLAKKTNALKLFNQSENH